MTGLTWRELLMPEYVMTFLEGFLLAFMPSAGFGQVATTVGDAVTALTSWPHPVVMIAAVGFGLMSGIRSLRNLRAPAPTREPTPARGGTS